MARTKHFFAFILILSVNFSEAMAFESEVTSFLSSRDITVFSDDDIHLISEKNLWPIIKDFIIHPNIKLTGAEQIIDFALAIKNSGFDFKDLEEIIQKAINQNDPPFSALRYAIKSEQFRLHKMRRIEEVWNATDPFIDDISSMPLRHDEKQHLINAYAVCIDAFSHHEDRVRLKPVMCKPMNRYKRPRYKQKESYIRTKRFTNPTTRSIAYNKLIESANIVAEAEQLDIFEKMKMAKCIAEQALQFSVPSHHPLHALQKSIRAKLSLPENSFFMKTGVCSNFAGIALDVANHLGLKGQVFLARSKFHTYLEFTDGKDFYHTHPFNNLSNCDIIRFNQIDVDN